MPTLLTAGHGCLFFFYHLALLSYLVPPQLASLLFFFFFFFKPTKCCVCYLNCTCDPVPSRIRPFYWIAPSVTPPPPFWLAQKASRFLFILSLFCVCVL